MLKQIYILIFLLPVSNLIVAQSEDLSENAYSDSIPGSTKSFEMVPIISGEFMIGSPASEAIRDSTDEGPQREVKVDGFWMMKFEVTWDIYELFMDKKSMDSTLMTSSEDLSRNKEADAVSRPSPPYEDPSFGMGKYGYPAGSMTQFAALEFCKWLSIKTGHFYRLPTEAEWEYACRAGSETAYSFGDNVTDLKDYGWYYDDSHYSYHKVGEKKPNAWGLYDMMGNVAEWTLDQYYPDFYKKLQGDPVMNPWSQPTQLDPRTVRGGSYDDDADRLRCASRIPSNAKKWKQRDPQIPKSFWWNTDSPFVGFRIVRPFKEMTPEQIRHFWAINLDE
jgi:formylglycine-generating enzyme required for sulfatase activity